MSNSGNTLNKKTIIAIVIIAVLLIAAIIGVVVFLKDQGETSAMAENGSQTSSDENVQARQEEQKQEPQEQAQTEEQSADTQNNNQEEQSTEVATTNDGATNDGANQGGATTGTTNNSGSSTGTTNSGNNANNNDNDAENIQESVIEETETIEGETFQTVDGERYWWTPQALATVSAIAGNMQLNAPNLVTEKTSVVVDKDGNEIKDATTVALDQKVKYTITITNIGNADGIIEKDSTFDTLPEGFDYDKFDFSKDFSAEIVGNDEKLTKEDITVKDQKAILNKDITLAANGGKLTVTYYLKVDKDYLKDDSSKTIEKNVVTVNNLPVEDDKVYDAVKPDVKASKTSKIYRDGKEVPDTDKVAKKGDKIRYTIIIDNSEGKADTSVHVQDKGLTTILANATFDWVKRSDNGPIELNDLTNGFDLTIYKETSLTIEYEVTINEIEAEKSIKNGIEVTDNNKEDNPAPEVPEKEDEIQTVDITGEKYAENETVKENGTIKYTIKLTNNGTADGEVKVKDDLTGKNVTFNNGSLKIDGEKVTNNNTAEGLKDGIPVTVPAGKTVKVTFEVTANIIEGNDSVTVYNKAEIVDEDGPDSTTNEEETTIEKATVNIQVVKKWKDGNTDGSFRPEEVNFVVKGRNNSEVNTDSLYVEKDTDKKEQKTSIITLPKYDSNGEINYTIEEVIPGEEKDVYYTQYGNIEKNENGDNITYTITNKFELNDKNNTQKIPVAKVWNDNKKEHSGVTLTVTGNDKTSEKDYDEVTLTSEDATGTDANRWEGVATVPVYTNSGEKIKYTVDEKVVPDKYIKTVENNVITNSLPSIDITKEVETINGDKIDGAATVVAGNKIGYKITVTNNSSVTIPKVEVTDKTHAVYLADENYNITSETASEHIDTLKNFTGSRTYYVVYVVSDNDEKTPGDKITNEAYAEGTYKDSNNKEQTVDDSDSAENATVTVDYIYDISIDKKQNNSDKNINVSYGDAIKYTITVTNNGNTTLYNVNVTDLMKKNGKELDGLENIKVDGEETTITDEGVISIGTLKAGEKVEITAEYKVKSEDISKDNENSITNTASVTATTDEEGKTPVDNDDDDEDEVTATTNKGEANLKVTKTSEIEKAEENIKYDKENNKYTGNKDVAESGDIIKYIITVSNKDGDVSGTATVTDSVPKNTTLFVDEDHPITGLNEQAENDLKDKEKQEFTQKVTVEPNKEKEIIFYVKVGKIKPGTVIKNEATTDVDSDKDGEKDKPTKTDTVEKTIEVTKNTTSTKVVDTNVVLVIDLSGSMNYVLNQDRYAMLWEESRLDATKEAVVNLIQSMIDDGMGVDNNISTISVITFKNNQGNLVGMATNTTEASDLKEKVNRLTASSGTYMSKGLEAANTQLNALTNENSKYKDNNNIVIFLGDGRVDGETENKVTNAAKNLKDNEKTQPTVYSIGIGSKVDENLLKNTIASKPKNYIPVTNDLSEIEEAIESSMKDFTSKTETDFETSEDAKVLLDNIDTSKDVTVNEEKLKFDSDTQQFNKYIVKENGKYYLDLTKFDADEDVSITYTVKS